MKLDLTNPVHLLHYLANHDDILRWVAPGMSEVSVERYNRAGVWLYGTALGAVLFEPIAEQLGLYEMHFLFTEALRGKAALDTIRLAISQVFTEHGGRAICGAVPRTHRASRVMARALGARSIGSHTDSFGRACVVYRIERKSWAISSAAS